MSEKYNVTDFCKKYNATNVAETKDAMINKIMNPHYVPYENKATICEKIIDITYHKKMENGDKKLYINSPAKYMHYCLYLVKEYTHLDIDFKDSLNQFNLLNGSGILDLIMAKKSLERELGEFALILEMTENDVLQNEYNIYSFISNHVERFGFLTGNILEPIMNKVSEQLENVDEKNIDIFINKLDKLMRKIK